MTQCSTSKIGDAPLYNSCSLPIQVITTGPLPAPSKCNLWIATNNRDVPRVIPWCNQVAGGRPWMWQQDSALAHKSKETQAWLQKESYDFVPFFHCPPSLNLNPLDYFVWSYVENITNMTSHNTKASLIAEYSLNSHRRLWKRHAPSSRAISRQWLRLKAATSNRLNRCQLYYIIKLPELIFSIKVLK